MPTITLGLWWRRATKEGAIACVTYGLLSTIIFSILVGKNLLGMGWAIWLIVLGSLICYVIGSLLSQPLPEEKLNEYTRPRSGSKKRQYGFSQLTCIKRKKANKKRFSKPTGFFCSNGRTAFLFQTSPYLMPSSENLPLDEIFIIVSYVKG
ncbi:MAG: hypothetical protein ACOX1I_04605 [Dethiobacteria bacterium]